MTYDELPAEWQAEIRNLRSELKAIRGRKVEIDGLPAGWHREFTRMRRDTARMRVQRNEARAELAALRAEVSK